MLCRTLGIFIFLATILKSSQGDAGVTLRCLSPSQSPEKRVLRSSMAVKALVANTYPDERCPNGYLAELWLLDVYKGADKLAASLGLTLAQDDDTAKLRDRRVNVSRWGDESKCWNSLVKQKTYIIILTSSGSENRYGSPEIRVGSGRNKGPVLEARYDEHFGAAIDFSMETERKILKALGWNPWTEWGSCSATCGGGSQIRQRSCAMPGSPGTCPTYNVEKRSCNTFDCQGAINTLSVTEERYYKPAPSAFQRVPLRPSAWLIRPGSYFLLPFKQAFGKEFPREFTIFLTIKPTEESEGIIFSLNGRKSRQEYISLGLNGGRLELVHSLPNGSKIIDIPAKISDGNWHQLALSVQGGSSVRTYLDCHWITTQILHSHSLAIPPDTDLIVGYMFQGELEQLTVSDALFSVSQQCSPNAVPHRDESLMSKEASPLFPPQQQQQQQMSTTTTTLSPTASDIAVVEIIDDRNNKGKVLSWKSEHHQQQPSRDYLEEEYVDLDWKEVNPVLSDQPDDRDEKRKRTKPETSNDKPDRKKPVPIDSEEGSGSDHGSDQEEEAKKDIGSGGGEFELEWSSWTTCSATCGEGQQFRTSRCQDNGYLEECIAAGVERRQVRSCKRKMCNNNNNNNNNNDSSNKKKKPKILKKQKSQDVVEYEMITRTEVESIKKRLLKEEQQQHNNNNNSNNNNNPQNIHLIPTHMPRDATEEQTNSIPHIPNYWIPVKSKSQDQVESSRKPIRDENKNVKSDVDDVFGVKTVEKCFCRNGGFCVDGSTKCRCRKGYTGKKCERPICRPDCVNKGECIAPDVCSCPEGFTGARCQQAFCYPSCLNGGTCVAPFQCACPMGVGGAFCQEFSCQPKCENGGLCIGHNVCSCPHGFSGPDCRDRTCTAHCENGGLCTMPDNLCKCRQGFYGARCHKKICRRYIAVREPQRRSYKQVVDVEYDSICGDEQSEMVTCKKTRPEYRTIVKVVYRTAYKCSDDLVTDPESKKRSKKNPDESKLLESATMDENPIQ